MHAKPAVATLVLALALALGASGCGKDGQRRNTTPSPSATSTATEGSTPSTPGTPSSPPPSSSSPVAGLPAGFPAQAEVPLVPGVVTSQDGGTNPEGKVGWILELAAAGNKKDCFDRAAAALTSAGFTKQGELDAGETHQAQFTTKKWAVIISASPDGDNCRLGYEVGQLGQ